MNDLLDIPACANPDSDFNTGIPLCDHIKGRIRGNIFLDKGVRIPANKRTSIAVFIGYIAELTTKPRGQRAYPVWDLLNFEDNTGDPQFGAVGNLTNRQTLTQEAVPAFNFGYDGAELRHRRMVSLMNSQYDVLFVDDKWGVYGWNDDGDLAGYSISMSYVDPSKFTTGDAVNKYRYRITLSDIYEYRDAACLFIANKTIVASVKGLITVTMSEQSSASNVYKIDMYADGGTNMQELYGDDLDALTFTAELEDGSELTITSVAEDTALKCFTVTFDTTEFAALASAAKIYLKGPLADAMATAGIKPYEILTLTIVKP